MYIVTETQTAANGAVSVLPPIVKENDLEARSVFFQICAAICISDIPIHTVTLETNEGFQIDKYTVYASLTWKTTGRERASQS